MKNGKSGGMSMNKMPMKMEMPKTHVQSMTKMMKGTSKGKK